MTNNLENTEPDAYNPASMRTSSLTSSKAVWYQRPWVLIIIAIVVMVAASVAVDLPHPISTAEDAAAQNATLKQVNADIAPCGFAITESFNFYQRYVTDHLTPSQLGQVPPLLVNDQSACSFTSGYIYDLTNNIQVDDTTAGKHVDLMLSVIVNWITSDALAAIEDIQYLFSHRGEPTKIHDLMVQESRLSRDRTLALSDLAAAKRVLGVPLDTLKLPALPTLPGT